MMRSLTKYNTCSDHLSCCKETDFDISNRIAILLIIGAVIVFNLAAVFDLQVLRLDDYARYFSAINHIDVPRSLIGRFVKSLNQSLMLIDIRVARLFYLLILCVPVSLLMYYFNRKYMQVPVIPAMASAITMNILPYQSDIPKFIDGSYILIVAFFLLLALIFSSEYLKSKNGWWVIGVLVCWFFASRFSEISVFMLPAVVLLVVLKSGHRREKSVLIVIFAAVIVYKLASIFGSEMRTAGSPTLQSIESISLRLRRFINWASFLPWNTKIKLFVISIPILLGMIPLLLRKGKKGSKGSLAVVFYGFLCICTTIPFIFVTPYFSARYFYVSYAALYVLWYVCVYELWFCLWKQKSIPFFAILTACLITFMGIRRHLYQLEVNYPYNKMYLRECERLHELGPLKDNAQIAMIGINLGTGEHYMWSSGYISYCFRRSGVCGIIGKEYFFYNPFREEDKQYHRKMGGLDIDKPVYVIKYTPNGVEYPQLFLQWIDRGNPDSYWIIYRRNHETHCLEVYIEGQGIGEYETKLKYYNISSDNVLWGQLSKTEF